MARRKKVETSQLELSLFSPEDFLGKVETALQEAPSPIEPTNEDENTFDRERLIQEMRTADDFLQGRDMRQIRLIAMQMTMQYQLGLDRRGHYSLQAVLNKELDWYQFVALYYTSFAISFPSMIDKLDPKLMECYKESKT